MLSAHLSYTRTEFLEDGILESVVQVAPKMWRLVWDSKAGFEERGNRHQVIKCRHHTYVPQRKPFGFQVVSFLTAKGLKC